MAIDTGKLEEFPGRFITDLGETVAAGSVVIGHRPGLYQARAAGPVTAGELAAAPAPVPATSPDGCAGSADRCVEYDPAAGAFSMTEAYPTAFTGCTMRCWHNSCPTSLRRRLPRPATRPATPCTRRARAH